MKLFIISDIHGSYTQAKKAVDAFNLNKADKLIILGDLYYHGPRNKLPEGYNPMEVSKLLNSIKDKIIALKGNCDAEVDEYISEFSFTPSICMDYENKKFLFTHGHHPFDNPNQYNVIFSGHTHIKRNEKVGNTLYINPGSISLPKADNSSNYIIVENNSINFYDINTNELVDKVEF